MTDWPVLMDLKMASRYTGVAFWTLRGFVIDGLIRRVVLPGKPDDAGQPRQSRRILVHRDDLDDFCRTRRERNTQPLADDQPMTTAVKRAERRRKTPNRNGRSDMTTAVPE